MKVLRVDSVLRVSENAAALLDVSWGGTWWNLIIRVEQSPQPETSLQGHGNEA